MRLWDLTKIGEKLDRKLPKLKEMQLHQMAVIACAGLDFMDVECPRQRKEDE